MACSEGGEPVKRLSDIPLEIAERLDLPAESVAGVPKLTVTGRRRALVENHCGLLEYSHECIVVDGGRVRVCIRGHEPAARGHGQHGAADLRHNRVCRICVR